MDGFNSIQELTEDRQIWVDASRRNNFEKGIKNLLTELYPDNAHFIYELLQNAEDTGASTVRFTLSEEGIDFEHNGKHLFNIRDVESITSIGDSTKRDDPTNIGKFGVGFKAVFAYSNTPEIHSGDFHFRIQDLVVPVTEGVPTPNMGNDETRFVFPFDHPTKQPARAVEEIERGLRSLGNNTLLFLGNIHLIEYILPDGSLGVLERVDRENGHIEIYAEHPGGQKEITHWLRYHKDVEITDEDDGDKKCRIAIAYSLKENKDQKKQQSVWSIQPIDRGQVSIYFPAEKETSNLRFHIHAPFASTVARDSVRDCVGNHQLRNRIADLVVESLDVIRDRGMLVMGFLAVLPNPLDGLPQFYEPIRGAVVRAFRDNDLTPTKAETHAPSTSLYRGPAKISRVIGDHDLCFITGDDPPIWAANPPQQNQREDRFLDSLEMHSWVWYDLATAFSWLEEEELTSFNAWIESKEDSWMLSFYSLLGEACEVHDECVYPEELKIVRIATSQGDEHVTAENVFFPTELGAVAQQGIQFVKPALCQHKYATAFLEHLGVRTYDEKAMIELRLEHYQSGKAKVEDSHFGDIVRFLEFWKQNKSETHIFTESPFLLGISPGGKVDWYKPKQLCIDAPYLETGLKELGLYAVWDGYEGRLSKTQLEDFSVFLEAAGIMSGLKIVRVRTGENPHNAELKQDYYQRGVRWTSTAIDEDYSIPDLEKYLSKNSITASRLVWNTLTHAASKVAQARYRPNQQYPLRKADSQLICHLKNSSWLPDKEGSFRRPEEMTNGDLRNDFPLDDSNGLLTAIGFGKQARIRSEEYLTKNGHAKEIGFESAEEAEKMVEIAKLMRTKGESLDKLIEQLQPFPQQRPPSFPSRPIVNPERRQDRLVEQLSDAAKKKHEKRERSVRTTNSTIDPITWLRTQYTNDDEQMICQVCKEEMPFRKRDGKHYFEKKEVLSQKYLPKEHETQYLALCPLCAAKYKEFIIADEAAMAALKKLIVAGEDFEIPISLGDQQTSIRFVESHFHDLKTIIEDVEFGEP